MALLILYVKIINKNKKFNNIGITAITGLNTLTKTSSPTEISSTSTRIINIIIIRTNVRIEITIILTRSRIKI